MLLASILLPLILFLSLGATRTAEFAKQVKEQPAADAAAAADAAPGSVYPITAVDLYRSYEANEVATDVALHGKVIQVSGWVSAIDNDAFNNIEAHLATSNDFSGAMMKMADNEAGTAGQLSKGKGVTIRGAGLKRVMGSPYGTDCVFVGD